MEIWAKTGSEYRHSTIAGQGSKNAALPLLIASIFTARKSTLRNVPIDLEDVRAIVRSLEWLGVTVQSDDRVLRIDASALERSDLPPRLSSASRYSLLFLGGLVGRTGAGKIGPPGGCQFGKERGFDFHQLVLEQFGCELRQEGEWLLGRIAEQKASEVTLPFPSVGATLQALIFLTASNRSGAIHNAAIEPEILDVVDFLNKSGCDIRLHENRSFSVRGYPSEGVTHVVPVDRIHVATVMAYSAISNTSSVIQWDSPIDLQCLTDTFSGLGISALADQEKVSISVEPNAPPTRFDVVADVYPGFPTDALPLIVAATIRSGRKVRFYDKVFSGRNTYLEEFVKLGARVTIVSDREFIVDGVASLTPSDVSANDIRGSTSLLLAAIQTESLSRIKNARQIARGYERLPLELSDKGFNVHVKNFGSNPVHRRTHILSA
ncbi:MULTISPECIES: UDP-N-acetylglucosamine 1-carboxyvinyltransferase [Burkholderia]|uniref:UDP-N-acetylglucosamine 1-carboxyvinyltransferase n=1 Tax=Burkholderia TaxID=32008 RepID=UPI000A1A140C|nr:MULTISPECIES: hypothetical protein [Burkholderia]ARK82154.1 hypothetical protein BOC40_18630 [Burkholderia pseudomallei]ARL10554.1 hypothetical protein BOC45_18660 [Burkholderia pseudomallei]ARL47881.1 hypothetical protein BOC50_34520 [Burkholderia pseudomallei]HEB3535234.1 hypothetical protein [Burkholderia cenocepacia]